MACDFNKVFKDCDARLAVCNKICAAACGCIDPCAEKCGKKYADCNSDGTSCKALDVIVCGYKLNGCEETCRYQCGFKLFVSLLQSLNAASKAKAAQTKAA
ncbi:hypothetical protein PoB_001840200 [Plakobranchus ocellatus]|uniref:Uncharacterized protein n=1 Tax=Plakobranchus ocellatus TaxID=259542 RepID=A0AAV3ZBI2_9GAST|nr:hypothetical protein PoB_001840200 [Plakobranchus ocellatus]